MSNIGFHKALKEHGCKSVTTAVGDRYVLERMRQDGYSLGGEQSGHIISSIIIRQVMVFLRQSSSFPS